MCIYSYRASVSRERKGYICVCIDAKELKKCYESWQDANVKNEIFQMVFIHALSELIHFRQRDF